MQSESKLTSSSSFFALMRDFEALLELQQAVTSDIIDEHDAKAEVVLFDVQGESFVAIAAFPDRFVVYCEVADMQPDTTAQALKNLFELNLELAEQRSGQLGIEAGTERLVHTRFFSIAETTASDFLSIVRDMAGIGRQARELAVAVEPKTLASALPDFFQPV